MGRDDSLFAGEQGDLFLALGRYNGSRGRPEYPSAVFAARRVWLRTDKAAATASASASAPVQAR